MKTFRIFKSDGKPETIEAEKAEYKKSSKGLSVKFFTDKKVVAKYDKVTILLEDSPAIIPLPNPASNEQDD